MARKKVNLQWITHASSRRATYRRRCTGMKKKVDELATLCDAKVGVVLYGEGQVNPVAWPNAPEAREIFMKFKDMEDYDSRFKKQQSQEELLNSRISKLQRQVTNLESENYKREIAFHLYESMDGRRPGLVGTTERELTSLREMVEEKTKEAKERLGQLQLGIMQGQAAAPQPPLLLHQGSSSTPPVLPCTFNEIQTSLVPGVESLRPQHHDWFADLTSYGGELGAMVSRSFNGSSSLA